MTFTCYKASTPVQRGPACPLHAGNFLDFLARRDVLEIDLLAPFSGQANVVARKPGATYILQKDPDGSWFIDRVAPDTAAAIRPIAAPPAHDGYRAPASDHAAFIIIEIG